MGVGSARISITGLPAIRADRYHGNRAVDPGIGPGMLK